MTEKEIKKQQIASYTKLSYKYQTGELTEIFSITQECIRINFSPSLKGEDVGKFIEEYLGEYTLKKECYSLGSTVIFLMENNYNFKLEYEKGDESLSLIKILKLKNLCRKLNKIVKRQMDKMK